MKVHCPQCRGTFRVEGEETGTRFQCPFCKAPTSARNSSGSVCSRIERWSDMDILLLTNTGNAQANGSITRSVLHGGNPPILASHTDGPMLA